MVIMNPMVEGVESEGFPRPKHSIYGIYDLRTLAMKIRQVDQPHWVFGYINFRGVKVSILFIASHVGHFLAWSGTCDLGRHGRYLVGHLVEFLCWGLMHTLGKKHSRWYGPVDR